MKISRRSLVLGALGGWAVARPLLAAQPPTGWVLPRLPAPALLLTGTDGQRQPLPEAIYGKVTAVQLMFTGCSSTCPTQGALFAALAERRRSGEVQFLSLSIDALGDSPATLSAWQSRFGRNAAWRAALPKPVDVDRLAEFMKGLSGRPGTHTAQVFVFDAQAKLCYRTGDNPAIGEVEALLAQVARQA